MRKSIIEDALSMHDPRFSVDLFGPSWHGPHMLKKVSLHTNVAVLRKNWIRKCI